MHANERLFDSFGEHGVHSESLTRPVDGNTQRFLLQGNAIAVLLLPLPDFSHECFPAELMPTQAALFLQLPLHNVLGSGEEEKVVRTVTSRGCT